MNLLNNITNINDCWVVVKRFNGKIYFKGRTFNTFKNPSTATIFNSKEAAQLVANQCNEKRKKCKFYIDNASKYFVNGWQVESDWYTKEISIKNKPVPIDDITSKRRNIVMPDDFKKKLADTIAATIKSTSDRLEQEKKQYEERINAFVQVRGKYEELLNTINPINFEEMLKPYATGAENTLRVLFEAKK